MSYINLSLDFRRAKFVEKSKEPKDGFERNDWTFHDRTGTNYRRFINSISGVVTNIREEKVDFGGRSNTFLKVFVKDNITGDTNVISVDLWGKYGMESDAKTLLGGLKGMIVGEEVTITPKENLYTNKKGVEKKSLNVYINYKNIQNDDGKSSSTGYIPYDEIPRLEEVVKLGKTTWNSDKVDEFYYNILKSLETKFENNSTTVTQNTANNNVPTANPQDAFSTTVESKVDEHDDLPF